VARLDPLVVVEDSKEEPELVAVLLKLVVVWSSASWSLRYLIFESTKVSSSFRRCSDCGFLQTLFLFFLKK